MLSRRKQVLSSWRSLRATIGSLWDSTRLAGALAKRVSRYAPSRMTKVRKTLIIISVILVIGGIFFHLSGNSLATWYDDNFAYRKKITIGNTGSADANKKVKLDINTATAVDPNTANFNTTDQTFTPLMAKRNSAGPFAAGVMVQGDSVGTIGDNLSYSRGSQINSNFYQTMDVNQGSISLWITPEWNGNDNQLHVIWWPAGSFYLRKETNNTLLFRIGGNISVDVSSWTAGTTYHVIGRWDYKNTLDGTNYASLSINGVTTFGVTSFSAQTPSASQYIGVSNGSSFFANAIIEGLTIYRRPLYEATTPSGINVGNGDEISSIYNSGTGKDPTLVTGSWDVVFDLPTNASTGNLGTGTSNAWTHPHLSNLLYTSTTNTGGFMMNGTYTSDGWADEGTPTAVAALATGEKIYPGGYKTTSDAANEGIYYDKTVVAGNDWVVRAVAHSDGTSVPKIILYDQTNGAEIGSLTGTTTSTRAAPDVFIFSGEAPALSTTLRVKLINTATTGVTYWHQVEVLSDLITNPSAATGTGDPWIPTGWSNQSLDAGEGVQEATILHSGSSSLKIITNGNEGASSSVLPSSNSATFVSTGAWVNAVATAVVSLQQYDPQDSWTQSGAGQQTFLNGNNGSTWTHYKAVARYDGDGSASFNLSTTGGGGGSFYTDDLYAFNLTDVSLTVTPASQANSTETSGLRVDGIDTSVTSSNGLSTTTGTVKVQYTPRHSAADVAKFGNTTPYIGEWYGDADDYIRVYWNAANSITLAYSMNGTAASSTWSATGAIVAGTTYAVQVAYTGGSTMVLSVGGTARITLSSIPAAFGTAPTTAYWGSSQTGANQGDATFAATTVSTGTKMQSDCDDVRFTDINGLNLKYYFDSTNGPCNIATSDFYVLMPTINTGNNVIYMYYGNPSVSSGSQTAQFSQSTFSPTSGPTLASEEQAPQPAAYWKFDDGQGSTAQDSTVNNNDGTLGTGSSAPTWTEESRCVSGKCLQFDGSNDYVSVSNTVNNIQSVSFWTRPATTSEQFIDLNGSAYIQSSSGTISATGFTSPTIYVDGVVSSTITANKWSYVSVTTGTALTGSVIKVAQVSTNYGQVFMDEVKIYPYARTAAQVKADFVKGSSAKGGGVLGAADTYALSQGLVGYWKLDESATPAIDSSGNGNSGTWAGDAASAAGKYGNGITLDGTGDYINVGSAVTDIADTATISLWTKFNSSVGDSYLMNNSQGQYYLRYAHACCWASNGYFNFTIKIGGADKSWLVANMTTAGIPFDTWVNVVVTYNKGTAILYVNNKIISWSTVPTVTSTTADAQSGNLLLGSYNGAASFYLGVMDEVRIYTRALTTSEVSQLYNFAPGPKVHLKMDEGTGTSANDSSGNANTGTLNDGSNWGTGKYGKGVTLDGTNDDVSVPDVGY